MNRPFNALAILALITSNSLAAAPQTTAPIGGDAAPSITITREGEQLKITFTGALHSATTVNGPWSVVAGATSPRLIDPLEASTRFYRSSQSTVESVFASRSVVEWTLAGPFQRHFELAFAGMPDGIFPPVRLKPYFEGTLAMEGYELPVSLRVRGNSSLLECPFPKLKVKISKEDREGTPFFDAREIKVGSHCAEGGRGPIGRLRDETATFREALAYEVLELMEFVAPRVRRARIEYRDTTPQDEHGDVGWTVERNALLLDDIEVVGERMGGRALSDEEISDLKNAHFDPQLIADMQLFHALIGNWDYALSENGEELWNTDVIQLPDETFLPVAADFDLASWVTGEVRLNAPHDYRPELPDLERQAYYEVEQVRNRVGATRYNAGRDRFTQRRAAIETLVQTALVDEPGRTNALQHVTVFFQALAE